MQEKEKKIPYKTLHKQENKPMPLQKNRSKTIYILLLAACVVTVGIFLFQQPTGKEDTPASEQEKTSPQTPEDLPLGAHLSYAYKDDLPGLLQKKYIRVLTTLNRTNFFISEGHLVGYEYSLLKAYEKHLNKKLGKKALGVVLEFIPVNRDELMAKLTQGYGDIAAAGLTITPERKKQVQFTIPYRKNVQEIIVSNTQDFTPKSLEDLAGHSIYVRTSSSYHQSLMRLNDRLEQEDLKPVKIKDIGENIETESILEMVNSGALGLTVADNHIAEAWSKALPDLVLHEDIAVRKGGKIAWMVRKNNPKLLASLDSFLKTHKQGTRLGNIYFERYYSPKTLLKNPADHAYGEKLKTYEAVIKKYAKMYDFDWLLILAMAFQESGLDNAKESHAGAVGLMQVRPATAGDANIGIKNVRKLQNNVHAGVKYLHFLRDQYFSDPSIRPRDQIRFALASYNAGPANIRRARQATKKMGLDPNRWFRNVELAVLKSIGRETVRYVSNINKYYILYTTIFENDAGDEL